MSAESDVYSSRAAELRRQFDESFAAARQSGAEALETVLALSIGGDRFALRTSQIAGIAKCGKIVPVPARTHALLGLAGIRGELTPVFSLAQLLGYDVRGDNPWLLLCAAPGRVGLAFGGFNGCCKVSPSAFTKAEQPAETGHSHEVVTINAAAHTVIEVPVLMKLIAPSQEGSRLP